MLAISNITSFVLFTVRRTSLGEKHDRADHPKKDIRCWIGHGD